MSVDRPNVLHVYALASAGDQEAYAWLVAWHLWIHAIDDHVDESHRARAEVVDLCAQGVVLCSSGFYGRHAGALGPAIAVIAQKYRASLDEQGGGLRDALRIAGNDMTLLVAYLRGGAALVRQVSDALWPIVERDQLSHGSAD